MIYLAAPYASPNLPIMQERFERVTLAAAKLMKKGYCVYSPITHNHPIATRYDFPRTWDFWQTMDLPILAKANSLWVLKLPGWENSTGVTAEIAFAKAAGIPRQFIFEEDLAWPK